MRSLAMTSLSLAIMAFLMLLGAQLVSAGDLVSSANTSESSSFSMSLVFPPESTTASSSFSISLVFPPEGTSEGTPDYGPSSIDWSKSIFGTVSSADLTSAAPAYGVPSSVDTSATSAVLSATSMEEPTSTTPSEDSTISQSTGSSSLPVVVHTSTRTVFTTAVATQTAVPVVVVTTTVMVGPTLATEVAARDIATDYLSTETVVVTTIGGASETNPPVFTQYPWPTFTTQLAERDDLTKTHDVHSSQPVFTQYPWPTFVTGTKIAARDNGLSTISIAGDQIDIVTAMNADTTFPLALVTDSAAPIPTTCQEYITTSGQDGTSVFLTYVARDCTVPTPTLTAESDQTTSVTAFSTTTLTVPTTATESSSRCFESGNPMECQTWPLTATISSTSTSTLTKHVHTPSGTDSAVVAGESSASYNPEPETTTISITTTPTSDVCAGASTVTITMQATPSTSTITTWIGTTITSSSASSSFIIVSGASPTASSKSLDTSTTVDGVTTNASTSLTTLTSAASTEVSSALATLTSTSSMEISTPMTPITPTTPGVSTPATPTPSTFTGGSGAIRVDKFPGLLAIVTLVSFLLYQ
ncbi:hypothetical protein GTA08_BOTSDO05998 [Neofusicoccum parvum]|nr:hypothetical protein GTA08_BOTSDO05998 [Neofusicoccum parvum]